MIAESEIRDWPARYLAREIPLEEFEGWFVRQSWNMQEGSPEAAQRLASAIELRLAEHSSGHLTEEDFRRELRSFVTSYVKSV